VTLGEDQTRAQFSGGATDVFSNSSAGCTYAADFVTSRVNEGYTQIVRFAPESNQIASSAFGGVQIITTGSVDVFICTSALGVIDHYDTTATLTVKEKGTTEVCAEHFGGGASGVQLNCFEVTIPHAGRHSIAGTNGNVQTYTTGGFLRCTPGYVNPDLVHDAEPNSIGSRNVQAEDSTRIEFGLAKNRAADNLELDTKQVFEGEVRF
jgi:hypothetical protein